jgi:predicted transcriptional regulator
MGKQIVRVADVMKQDFDLIDGKETVASALEKMQQPNAHALIVNKRDADDEYGIVLLSDIAKKVLARDRAPERVNIYEIMSKPVLSVPPRMDIRYCARLFERFGLQRAPVMENEQLLGIVSYNDMVLKGCFETASK